VTGRFDSAAGGCAGATLSAVGDPAGHVGDITYAIPAFIGNWPENVSLCKREAGRGQSVVPRTYFMESVFGQIAGGSGSMTPKAPQKKSCTISESWARSGMTLS
jgi:hypothetical protein